MTKDEALKMAIEALENIAFEYGQLLDGEQDYGLLPSETNEDIVIAYRVKRACKEALEQPKLTDEKGRPMRYWGGLEQPANLKLVKDNGNGIKTYEILPTHQWQGLTDDEQDKLYADWERGSWNYNTFANAIEQALKEKNT